MSSITATSACCSASVPPHDAHQEELKEDEHGIIIKLSVIDMSDPDRAQIAKRLHEICRSSSATTSPQQEPQQAHGGLDGGGGGGGFFFLAGHGISGALQQQVLQQTQGLFDLPLGKKVALSDPQLSRGYTAMQEETLDVAHQTVGDAKEGFYLAADFSQDAAKDPAKLRGPNQWPDSADLPHFKTVMNAYFQQLSDVAFRLVQLLALSLDLDEHYFDDSFTEPMAALRLLHYNAGVSNGQRILMNENDSDGTGRVGIYGCGAHSDYGMITLLLTDGTPGLQIQTPQQKWLSVLEPPRHHDDSDDASSSYYVVNLGDMLERWTNGLYKSTVHRVILPLPVENDDDDDDNNSAGTKNRKNHRYSIPFFFEPNFDTVVECLPTCVAMAENRPAKYPPITSGQYLLDKYRQTHADFTPTTSSPTTTTTCNST